MIGDKIRDLRKKTGITQEQLAGHELTKSYVSQVELGRIHPSRKALDIIAKRLGKPLGYFLDNDDDRRTVDVLIQASQALVHTHRLEEALIGLKEARVLAERIGRDDMLAQIEAIMGRVDMARQDYEAAMRHLTSAWTRLHSGDDTAQIIDVTAALGEAAQAAGLFHEAVRYFNYSLDAARSSGNPAQYADALIRYGDFCLEMGQWSSALSLYEEAHRVDSEKWGVNVRLAASRARLGPPGSPLRLEASMLHDLSALPLRGLRWRLTHELVRALLDRQQAADAINLTDATISAAQSFKGIGTRDWAIILATALHTARRVSDPSLSKRYLALVDQQPDDLALVPIRAHALRIRAEASPDPQEALTLLDAACTMVPHDHELAVQRAVLAVRVGQAGALDALWALVTDHPTPDNGPLRAANKKSP